MWLGRAKELSTAFAVLDEGTATLLGQRPFGGYPEWPGRIDVFQIFRRAGMKKDEILAKLAAHEITAEEASKLLDAADQQKRGSLYCKVSQKGAISVYGLQRMPVTLYVEQWERLLDFGDEIRKFIEENGAQLKRKEK
jgi:hypothetical protein